MGAWRQGALGMEAWGHGVVNSKLLVIDKIYRIITTKKYSHYLFYSFQFIVLVLKLIPILYFQEIPYLPIQD